ncbi:ELMO/CED-12 family-domain-containing protein [Mycena floridula]|nr:ELMO/CED-12 family-domain-containing protein [Mycena floridula]
MSALSPTARAAVTNGAETTTKTALVPTNNVTTAEGVTVRARIDPTLTVEDVVKQLCVNLKIKGSSSEYALRDETDELVTNDNLRRKNQDQAPTVRLPLFSLQKFIREPEFVQVFLSHDGLQSLVDVIETSHGNTLAYALTSVQNLMELDYGWTTLDENFIAKVVQILTSSQSLINVCRPATAILKKLVEADPMSAPGTQQSGASPSPSSVYRYGFQVVYDQMRKEKGLLETVVNRLGSAETAMAQHSMMLINSLISHANENRWEEFISSLESLNVRKAVVRLMSSHTMEDLTSCILDFQANIVRVMYRKKMTPVDPLLESTHFSDLNLIWETSGLSVDKDEDGQPLKWRKLGFVSEDIEQEFNVVGVLGLDCLKYFVKTYPDFSKLVLEQLSRPAERRCPIGRASNEVVELLAEHWSIFAPGYSTSTTFQPFFLDLYRVHSLATQFFLRMWVDSGAVVDKSATDSDFARVATLVRSQVKVALRSENVRNWHEMEHDFLEVEYRAVRDRQMKELELEDDLLSKVPVRNLRAKIYKESYEFVRQQRIQCLLQGACRHPGSKDSARRPTRPWRFMRLDNGLKYLHYVDSAVKFPVRQGLEDLPDRIEIAAISEIATGTCLPPPNLLRDPTDLLPTSPLVPSALSFSLISVHEGSLADQIAPDLSRWADWTDGLNMLRRDSGHVASKETAGFVQALTEIGLKIKLLDLSGERVEIPSGLVAGPPPTNPDFFFSEL